MNTTELVHFHGQQIVTLRLDDGSNHCHDGNGLAQKIYVALRPIVTNLGLAWHGQFERLQRDAVLSTCVRVIRMQVPGDSQSRDHIFIELDMLNGWLFGIDANRVKPELRSTVIAYQRECYRVLAAHFHGKAQMQSEAYWFGRNPHWAYIRAMAYAGWPYRCIAQLFTPRRSANSVRGSVRAMVRCGVMNPETLATTQHGASARAAQRQMVGWGQVQQAFNFTGAAI